MFRLFEDKEARLSSAGFAVPKEKKIASHTVSLVKVYALITFSTILATLSSYLLIHKLFGYGSLTLLSFTMVFIVQSISLKRMKDIYLASTLNALGLAVFLYVDSLEFAISIFVILTIFFLLAHIRGRREISNMVKIRFFKAVRPGVGLLLLSIAIFTSFILFINGDVFLNPKNVNQAVDLIGKPIFGNTIQDFSSEMSMEDFLRGYVSNQIVKETEEGQVSALKKELAIRTAVVSTTEYLESVTQFKLNLEGSLGENIQNLIENKSESLSAKTQPTRLMFLILILVLAIKSIEFLLYIPLSILAFLLYELLLALDFIVVQFESRSKEVLNLL